MTKQIHTAADMYGGLQLSSFSHLFFMSSYIDLMLNTSTGRSSLNSLTKAAHIHLIIIGTKTIKDKQKN